MSKEIIMYGADWCADTTRAKKILDENNIEYTFLDIEDAKDGKEHSQIVMDLNDGKRVVPTFIIGDEVYSNPSAEELQDILGIEATDDGGDFEICMVEVKD